MEHGIQKSHTCVVICFVPEVTGKDEKASDEHYKGIKSDFMISCYSFGALFTCSVKEVEVYAGKVHEKNQNYLDRYTESSCIRSGITEATSSHGAESCGHCIEQTHIEDFQYYDEDQSYENVNTVEISGCILESGGQLAFAWTGSLCISCDLAADSPSGNKSRKKYNNAHSTEPVSKTAPEEDEFGA